MDITSIYNPIFTPMIIAIIVASSVILFAIWSTRSAVSRKITQLKSKLFTRAGFFWSSIFVFMAVSVIQAGAFFSISGNAIGFAVAFFFDLVTVVLMHAQLESRYRGENGRANLFIAFIVLTCGMSTFANLAISLNDFDASKMLHNAPLWVQSASPYALASFPLFVIMMSIAAEKIVNVRPLDKLKENEYDTDEQKRVRLLEIRNQYAIRQARIELEKEAELSRIKAQRAAQRAAHKAEMKRIKSGASAKAPANNQSSLTPTQPQVTHQPNTDKLEVTQEQPTANETETMEANNQNKVTEEEKQTCASIRSTGRTSVTINEAATLCNCEQKTIKKLRTRGILKRPSPNSDLITLASVEAYLNNHKGNVRKPRQDQKDQLTTHSKKTVMLPETLSYGSNGHAKETITHDEYPEILV